MKSARVVFRGGIPFSPEFDDIYFNADDPIGQSEYVFNSVFDEIWSKKSEFNVLETGFGAGLNFLCAFKRFKNSDKFLNLSDEEFLNALNEYENLLENIARVQIYVSLVFSKDTSKGAFYAKFDELSSKAQNHLLFFELKFNEFDEDRQNKIIAKSPRLGYYLGNIAKEKAHQLSLKEEQIRLNLDDLQTANIKRAQESARVLEECFKLVDVKISEIFKTIRYELYEIEKEI